MRKTSILDLGCSFLIFDLLDSCFCFDLCQAASRFLYATVPAGFGLDKEWARREFKKGKFPVGNRGKLPVVSRGKLPVGSRGKLSVGSN